MTGNRKTENICVFPSFLGCLLSLWPGEEETEREKYLRREPRDITPQRQEHFVLQVTCQKGLLALMSRQPTETTSTTAARGCEFFRSDKLRPHEITVQ